VPAPIADIAYQNKRVIYDLLMKAATETTLTIAADPRHWVPASASLQCCTPGAPPSPRTLTHDAWHYHLLDFQ
jgi:hypothetical protein